MLNFDPISFGQYLVSSLSGLFLPIILIFVLISILGGNANLGESLAEALGTALTLVFEIFMTTVAFVLTCVVTLLSAAVRIFLSYMARRQRNKIKLKTGPEG